MWTDLNLKELKERIAKMSDEGLLRIATARSA
jgi:hypothetical protein